MENITISALATPLICDVIGKSAGIGAPGRKALFSPSRIRLSTCTLSHDHKLT
jgi:hypothetical protein